MKLTRLQSRDLSFRITQVGGAIQFTGNLEKAKQIAKVLADKNKKRVYIDEWTNAEVIEPKLSSPE